MESPTLTLFSAVAGSRVDAAAGVIRGVSLITEGPALGHGVFIDATTLAQVKAAAETYSGGLKVKMDHAGGAGDIIGWIDGFRISGNKLLGDLHLLETSEHRGYVLEIAQKIPDTFGLSLAFSGGTETVGKDKQLMQRCTELYSCDLVSEPAANKGGLFSRSTKTKMDEPNKTPADPIAEALSQFAARLAKLEAFAFPPAAEPKKDEPAAMAANNSDAVLLALKELTAKFGTAPATVATVAPVVAPAKPEVKTFEALVAAKRTELKGDNAAAIQAVINSHPTEYAAYRARFGQGETIKL